MRVLRTKSMFGLGPTMRYGVVFAAVALALVGCAGFETASLDGPCLDDSPACIKQRTTMVGSLSSDTSHAWIGQSVGSATVASGVRLFAYQNVRDKLSCAELAAALTELGEAKQALAAGPAPGQTMLRHNEIKAMTEDVRQALAASKTRRCPAT